MTVSNSGPKAVTSDFDPGGIGYVNRSNRRCIKNIGDTDLVLVEAFASSSYQETSLSNWLALTPPAMVAAHLHIPAARIAEFPKVAPTVVPA